MAWTYGGGTGDDSTFSGGIQTIGADNGSYLVAGWWYPTTLTAGRGYWSAGNIHGATVGPTTSEMRLVTDNTTDGVWDSSGAGIVTNEWQFLAWLYATENTTVPGAVRFWRGAANTPPTEISVTNSTARSGNYTGSSSITIGNIGTGVVAFQGDIDWAIFLANGVIGINNPFTIGTSGVIDNVVAANVLNRWVLPIWEGGLGLSNYVTATQATSFGVTALGGDTAVAPYGLQYNHTNNNFRPNHAPTNGAIFSAHRGPYPFTPRLAQLVRPRVMSRR